MHRWSQLFIPTLREAPADAEVASHKLLLRAGYIRQLGAGIYSYLFLGNRSVNKIVAIVREEMDKIGQEFLLPALNPKDIWEASGRWTAMGDNMFRLKDRKGAELCLAMTHEEIVTDIARKELRSYKQLPQIWYQIQTKFRDEPRPKAGLLRVRQFIMKDAYSFDIDEAGLDVSYNKHDAAYRSIFTRCGLQFVAVDADSGAMGGSASQEFMVYTEAGEDLIASCHPCGYAANIEKATSRLAPVKDLAPAGDGLPELVHTPGQRTIGEVGVFLTTKPQHQIKTMAYIVQYFKNDDLGQDTTPVQIPVAVFLRGDHSFSEAKMLALIKAGGAEIRPMTLEEIEHYFGSVPGYLGPVGLANTLETETWEHGLKKGLLPHRNAAFWTKPPEAKRLKTLVVLDKALEGRTNLIAGANKEEYHLRNVTPARDFKPTLTADVRTVNAGEACPSMQHPMPGAGPGSVIHPFRPDGMCTGTLEVGKAVEIGHIFKLGRKYTDSMGASVLNRDGKEVTPIMGCYGIGIERILTAAIETSAAANQGSSYALHPAIAPFQAVVTITNVGDAALLAAGEKVAADLEAAGVDVLLDDRDERAGVKFKDADLVGIPYRINIGRGVAEGKVEFVDRLRNVNQDVPLAEVSSTVAAQIASILITPVLRNPLPAAGL